MFTQIVTNVKTELIAIMLVSNLHGLNIHSQDLL